MEPDRLPQKENDYIFNEYKQEIIDKSWSKTLKIVVAVTTLVLAVIAAIASFKAASMSNQVISSQNEIFNFWSVYQSKSIKEITVQTELNQLEIESSKTDSINNIDLKEKLYNRRNYYSQEADRYKKEKEKIMQEIKLAEEKHLIIKELSADFGNALIFLQIGILLSSLTTISKIKYYWFIGTVFGMVGFSIFIVAYYKNLTM